MFREMCKSKIHRATITEANLLYEGSIGIDLDLMEAADILPGERINVLNLNNGTRIDTYAIVAPRGSGTVCLNGAAARCGHPGDKVILLTYAVMDDGEANTYRMRIVKVDDTNRIAEIG